MYDSIVQDMHTKRSEKARGETTMKIPYCKSHYRLSAAQRIADQCRASGEYSHVWLSDKLKERDQNNDMTEYARVWVETIQR
jgi:hypothetical protein